MTESFVAVDIETTGLNPSTERIIEIGAVRVRDGQIEETFDILINPERRLSSFITELTGITDGMLAEAADITQALKAFLDFAGEDPLLGHHLSFDYSFLKKNIVNAGGGFERQGLDTLKIARALLPELGKYNLESLCYYYRIHNARAHRACEDARATVELYFHLREELETRELEESQREAAGRLFLPVPMQCTVKRDSPITAAQLRYLRALASYHKLELQEEPESLTKSEASRRIDHIILTCGKIPARG